MVQCQKFNTHRVIFVVWFGFFSPYKNILGREILLFRILLFLEFLQPLVIPCKSLFFHAEIVLGLFILLSCLIGLFHSLFVIKSFAHVS